MDEVVTLISNAFDRAYADQLKVAWPYPGIPKTVVAELAGYEVAGLPYFPHRDRYHRPRVPLQEFPPHRAGGPCLSVTCSMSSRNASSVGSWRSISARPCPGPRRPASAAASSRRAAASRRKDLTRGQQDLVELRLAHLLEAETGFRSGDQLRAAPGEPRPEYDTELVPLATARRRAKVAELRRGLASPPR